MRVTMTSPRRRRQAHLSRDLDQEGGYWWWPAVAPPTSTRYPLRDAIADTFRPARQSSWHRRVVRVRKGDQDGIAPYAARGVLAAIVIIALAVLGAPWHLYVLTAPAIVQVILEIATFPYVSKGFESPRGMRWMVELARDNDEVRFANVTGWLGFLACPALLVAVLGSPPGGDLGWVKICALAAAMLYLVGAMLGGLLSVVVYTEKSELSSFWHVVMRPFFPWFVFVVCVVGVAVTAWRGGWAPGLAPVAVLTAALSLMSVWATRIHDRVLDASLPVLRAAVVDARESMSRFTHDQLQEYKEVVTDVALEERPPTFEEGTVMLRMPSAIRHLAECADPDHDRESVIPLEELPGHIVSAVQYDPYRRPRVTVDVGGLAPLTRKHRNFVEMVLTGLVTNATQAQERHGVGPDARVDVRAWTTGEGRHAIHHLSVGDSLGEVPRHVIEESPSFRGIVQCIERAHGEFRQVVIDEGGKSFEIDWPERQRPTPLGVAVEE